jgi:branched-subunit amino acid ABC-type transport system permease component
VGDTITVALNGRIAAVSGVYRGPRFSALVPESAFRTGRNAVRAFIVTGTPAAPQLRELRVRLSS